MENRIASKGPDTHSIGGPTNSGNGGPQDRLCDHIVLGATGPLAVVEASLADTAVGVLGVHLEIILGPDSGNGAAWLILAYVGIVDDRVMVSEEGGTHGSGSPGHRRSTWRGVLTKICWSVCWFE